ncbi:MAG: insulinase family protein [Lachnospiraceae bacterium]|nr:insulinase family protein [Lachnospiraceae bacterium]
MNINELKAYEVLKDYYMEDLNSRAYLLKHKKTKALIALLSNEDDNKVFNIGFRTPVADDTGVPHIIEHTVLCGSKKYPVKDPFIELAKGSLNTFLNAMTYPDKTVYPVASCNDKDFKNLMDVYLDAVFNPRIYNTDMIFKQEGWHFELEDADGEIKYNGVVYNEMKGAFSSPDGVLERKIFHSLFPDNNYGNESGGDPEFIPELTYENYLDFHRRYYHPSNSYIYMYGNMDMVERLTYLDEEYLSKYDYLEIDSEIKLQQPFEEMKIEKDYLPISDGEDEEDNALLSYNFVMGTTLDKCEYQAIQLLDYALMGMPGAIVKQALLDAGIGKDVYGIGETSIRQPYYGFVAKFANASDADRFKEVIDDTLKNIVENGLDKKVLESAINNFEFKYREADFGRYPKGLLVGLNMFDSWLYDENEPFMHVEANETFAMLREKLKTDYFEKMIEKYMINNNHKSMVILEPKKGVIAEKEAKVKEKLKAYKDSLSDSEIRKLIDDTKALREYQEQTSTKEQLETIPILSIEDIGKEPRPIKVERRDMGDIEAVYHDYFTNGIGYLSLIFKNVNIPCELIPYLGLLKATLSYMDTDNYTFAELSNEINMHTGALAVEEIIHQKLHGGYLLTTEVNVKALYEKMPKAFELIEEVLFATKFDNYKRLLEIIQEAKSKLQTRAMQAGNTMASLRAYSYYSEPHYLREAFSGISFYKFVEKIEKNFDEYKETIANNLSLLMKLIFRKENLIVSYNCEKDKYDDVVPYVQKLSEKLFDDDRTKLEEGLTPFEFVPKKLNEGFKTSSQVQYVVRTGDFRRNGYEYTGHLLVLSNILDYEFLWNNIREKGGAYGCSSGFSRMGNAVFSSYRDPKLCETNKVYEAVPEYVENFDADDRDMTKYIIGTISSMDTPLTPADAGSRSLEMYLSEITIEDLRKTRTEVLSTDVQAIRGCVDTVRAVLAEDNLCVIGNEDVIEKNKEMFGEVKSLFE